MTEIYPSLGYIKMEYSVNGMNVDANRTCGKCLSQIRREQGITQVELAKKLGYLSRSSQRSRPGNAALGFMSSLSMRMHSELLLRR